ncbi:uncharacterized protein DUF4233 [Haloactinopolyspora alba]|uniref:Uncharacterized protein DUF4233 n=1 Tax=Haloactinopolyspora alba TaxID=648780 RepID=A0A2P8EBC6_9ACTN|nr:DUF4233 domain-containing protein [Haloactinopolyspora alba]PSL06766.1 uncharacterized protein DUF4233 [Haloactinopolyspora alba]
MSRIAATILVTEALVVLLAVPVAVNVSNVATATAWLVAGAIAAACVVGAGTVRRGRLGYVVGSVAQLAAVGTGFVVPAMFVLGGVFALMWFVLMRIGPEVERAQAARERNTGE